MTEHILNSRGMDLGRDGLRAKHLSSKAPIRHLDVTLMVVVLLLTIAGSVAVRSASSRLLQAKGLDPNLYLKRQLVYLCLAVIVFLICLLFDYRQLRDYAPLIYGAGVLLLVLVLTPIGHTQKGAQRWINFGVLQVQPAELMKVVLVTGLAATLVRERALQGFDQVLGAIAVMALPAILVYVQPDLGTVMVLFAVAFAMLVVAGTRLRWLAILLMAGIAMVGLALHLGILHEYQVERLTAFLDDRADPQVAGFNLAQSKIAIGSGGLTGKGIGRGSQTNLRYVPEQHTDFIFTAIGEEQGLVGAGAVLALFGILLWRSLRIGMLSKDHFGTILAAGMAGMFAFQFFVNIGMTMGIMPITGIPLPFVSYGGSSLITSYFGVGVLMNIHMRRFL